MGSGSGILLKCSRNGDNELYSRVSGGRDRAWSKALGFMVSYFIRLRGIRPGLGLQVAAFEICGVYN